MAWAANWVVWIAAVIGLVVLLVVRRFRDRLDFADRSTGPHPFQTGGGASRFESGHAESWYSNAKLPPERTERILNGVNELHGRVDELTASLRSIEREMRYLREMFQAWSDASRASSAATETTSPLAAHTDTRTSAYRSPPPPSPPHPPHADSGRAGTDWGVVREVATEFLRQSDSQAFDGEAITRFFTTRGLAVSFIESGGDHWALLAVHRIGDRSRALGIPAIRIGMGRIDLRPYFDLRNHNGFDHIHGSHVRECADLAYGAGEWKTTTKGVIDGSR